MPTYIYLSRPTYSVAGGLQFRKHAIQEFKLAGDTEKQIIGLLMWVHLVLDLFKYKWMVADFTELHDGVVQALNAGFTTNRILANRPPIVKCMYVYIYIYPFSPDAVYKMPDFFI